MKAMLLMLVLSATVLADSQKYPAWTLPTPLSDTSRGDLRITGAERLKIIHEILHRRIKMIEDVTNSPNGVVRLTAGVVGVKLSRDFFSPDSFIVLLTPLDGFNYASNHVFTYEAIDGDSIVIRAYQAAGQLATSDTTHVAYQAIKRDR